MTATTLPASGFLRLKQFVPLLIPIGRSTWWAGVRAGRFPQPVKLSARVTVWRVEDIRALIEAGRAGEVVGHATGK